MAPTQIISHIDDLPESFTQAIEDEAVQQKVLDDMVAWFYKLMLGDKRKHLLVRIHERFDLSDMVAACQGFHIHEEGGAGQAPTYTIEQLCRALIVQHLYDWSYRTAADEIYHRLVVRWFVGYPLYGPILSYSTLRRFKLWVQKHRPRTLFNTILKQIDEDFPEERKKIQAGDTYAMFAVVNAQSRTQLLRTSCQNLLHAIEISMPVVHHILGSTLEKEAIFGQEDAPKEAWLEIDKRKVLEVDTALAAANFLLQVEHSLSGIQLSSNARYADILLWQSVLDKVLADEFILTQDKSGRFCEAKLPTDKEREQRRKQEPTYRYGSTLDLEATFRNHGKSNDFGYNISIAATDNFIREIAAATGATPDASGIPPLLEAQLENLGCIPPRFVYDKAAGHPKYFHLVHQVTDGKTQLVARLIDCKKGKTYGPRDFCLDEKHVLTCPNGQQTSRAYYKSSHNGWEYRFAPEQCHHCPLLQKCRPDSLPTSRRTVFISRYLYEQQEAIAYIQTEQFELDMKFRSQIERIIAGVVRYNGGRHATSKGLDAADFQARMAATAYNLKRWAKLTAE